MPFLKNTFTNSPFSKPETEKNPESLSELVILFADISGSTKMYETLGDRVTYECITESLGHISRQVEAHQGVIVEVIGDEILSYFHKAEDAFDCACEIQIHFSNFLTSHGHPMKIHIGFYQGPVKMHLNHPYGDSVNVAARLTSLAKNGQIITTANTITSLSPDKKSRCRPFRYVKVKGKSDPLDTMEVMWDFQDSTMFLTRSPQGEIRVEAAEAEFNFRGTRFRITQQETPVTLGRSEENTIVIPSNAVSRTHARIEYRYGELVFIDHSTNGSFITTIPGRRTQDGLNIHLHHREWTMAGQGSISFGKPGSWDVSTDINFIVKR